MSNNLFGSDWRPPREEDFGASSPFIIDATSDINIGKSDASNGTWEIHTGGWSGDTITIPASQPLVPGIIYPEETVPLGYETVPLGYPVIPYPPEYDWHKEAIKKELTPEEIIIFLESLDMIPEESMRKIREALKPQKPIDYNNRIDDLIIDIIEE